MIEEVCLGAGVLVLLLIAVYLLFFSKPFKYTKRNYDGRTELILEAKRNLFKVSVIASEITFERKRVRKGQTVEFDYPASKTPAKLIVEVRPNKIKSFEI